MINLLNINDLEEGTSLGLDINDLYMFAVKKNGDIYLYWNRCPHIGTPLEWEENRFLDADAALIQCSTHGALFQIDDGFCLVGPCKGKHLQKVDFTIENECVFIDESKLQAPRSLT